MNENKSYVLIDSSIWIDFFKGNEKVAFVSNILLAGLACTNEFVLIFYFIKNFLGFYGKYHFKYKNFTRVAVGQNSGSAGQSF